MEFVPITEFRRMLVHYCPGLIVYQIDDVVRRVVTEFCKYTLQSQETMGPYSTIKDDSLVPLESPNTNYVRPFQVVHVEFEGRDVDPASEPLLARMAGSNWRARKAARPSHWLPDSRDYIRLYPTPDTAIADAVHVRVACVPIPAADEIDRELFDHWHTAIVDGALAQILAMPSKPWTDRIEADKRNRDWLTQLSSARALANRGNTNLPMTAEPRRVV